MWIPQGTEKNEVHRPPPKTVVPTPGPTVTTYGRITDNWSLVDFRNS